ASIGDPDRDAKPHPRIAVGPVCHRRINELRVWHDHRDVVVGYDDGAPGANLLDLTGDTRDFDAIPNRDWPFRQNDQPANEIAGDVLQAKADSDANGAGENG